MIQPTREDALAHFGVKGMRWGVRNDRSSSSSGSTSQKSTSTKKKIAIGIGAGLLITGAAVTAAVLAKNGKLPIDRITLPKRANQDFVRSELKRMRQQTPSIKTIKDRRTTERGAQTIHKLSEYGKFKKLLADFDADIAEAHAAETRYMLKKDPTYNPRTAPNVPPYELQRLRTNRMLTTRSPSEFATLFNETKEWDL